MSITWDLIWVKIGGVAVQGRPIEWDRVQVDSLGNDSSGDPLCPTKYMTTCPKCAQLVKFGPSDVSGDVVVCLQCAPKAEEAEVLDTAVAEEPWHTGAGAQTPTSPFVDPVLNKLVDLDNYDI